MTRIVLSEIHLSLVSNYICLRQILHFNCFIYIMPFYVFILWLLTSLSLKAFYLLIDKKRISLAISILRKLFTIISLHAMLFLRDHHVLDDCCSSPSSSPPPLLTPRPENIYNYPVKNNLLSYNRETLRGRHFADMLFCFIWNLP